jgi:hypothetical protein
MGALITMPAATTPNASMLAPTRLSALIPNPSAHQHVPGSVSPLAPHDLPAHIRRIGNRPVVDPCFPIEAAVGALREVCGV